MPKALLLENIHPDAAQSLRDHGFEVECLKGALSEDELIDALEGVDLLGIRSKTSVTRKVIDARPTLTAVGCFCIGTNQVDLEYAGKNGIAVFNAPYSNTRSVVELVIGDIICLMRRIPAHTHHMKHGMWDKSASGSHEVRGKTLGIIGYGNIGSQLSVVAEALGMRVLFYDIEEKLAMGNAHRCDTLNELLEQSDVVTLHVDGRKSNTGFFGEDQFEHMKQDAIFINLSRGFVADLDALKKHLDSGHLSGAAVDVNKIDVSFRSAKGRVDVCKNGAGIPFSEEEASLVLGEREIEILIHLHMGQESAQAYGCDLTYDYVKINGDYRT